jgi:hypothetical protein
MIQRFLSWLTAVSLAVVLTQVFLAVTDACADIQPGKSTAITVTPASDTAASAPATLKITRLLHRVAAEQLTRGRRIHVEGETIPDEYQADNSWLILKDAEMSDTAPLYRCDINAGKGSTLSRRTSHPDMTSHEIFGQFVDGMFDALPHVTGQPFDPPELVRQDVNSVPAHSSSFLTSSQRSHPAACRSFPAAFNAR